MIPEEGITVLSLFDGMSCGMIALDRLGIKVKAYYASEIDKPAMKVAKHNWPDIIHIGDVTKVGYFEGWLFNDTEQWYVGHIDLLIGGSPCQGFSFAGKQLNFEDPRSKLFFEYVRLKEETQCSHFLLENVMMKQQYQEVITGYLGVNPVKINSSLLSAQNRKRLYWMNIPYSGAPKDKGINMENILEYPFGKYIPEKSLCLSAGYANNPSLRDYNRSQKQLIQVGLADDISSFGSTGRIYSADGKAPCLRTMQGGNLQPKVLIANYTSGKLIMNHTYRKLNVLECERLQTVPDKYTAIVSNSAAYKMLGNGWTIDVICHLLEPLLYAV